MVSLSTSNERSTATRAPPGHDAGLSDRPARTALTTVIALSKVHCQPGFAVVCGTGCACANRAVGSIAKNRARFGIGCLGRREPEEGSSVIVLKEAGQDKTQPWRKVK